MIRFEEFEQHFQVPPVVAAGDAAPTSPCRLGYSDVQHARRTTRCPPSRLPARPVRARTTPLSCNCNAELARMLTRGTNRLVLPDVMGTTRRRKRAGSAGNAFTAAGIAAENRRDPLADAYPRASTCNTLMRAEDYAQRPGHQHLTPSGGVFPAARGGPRRAGAAICAAIQVLCPVRNVGGRTGRRRGTVDLTTRRRTARTIGRAWSPRAAGLADRAVDRFENHRGGTVRAMPRPAGRPVKKGACNRAGDGLTARCRAACRHLHAAALLVPAIPVPPTCCWCKVVGEAAR